MSFELPLLKNFETTAMLGFPFQQQGRAEATQGLMTRLSQPIANSFRQETVTAEFDGVDYDEHYYPLRGVPRNVYGSYEFLNTHLKARLPSLDNDNALENDGIDPLTLAQLKKEPQMGKDELFDEYGDKGTDFVNLIKRSRASVEKERQLYLTPEERKDERPSKKEKGELLSDILSNLSLIGTDGQTLGSLANTGPTGDVARGEGVGV